MRRLLTRLLVIAVGLAGVVGGAAAPARAQSDDVADDAGQVTVIEVSGLLDEVVADFVSDAIAAAPANGDLAVVLRVNSPGAVVSDERVVELADQIATSPVPVVAWVGPSGGKATGEVAQLVSVTAAVNVAPGSKLGDTGELLVEPTLWSDRNAARMANATLNWEQVIEVGIVPCDPPDVDELGRELTADQQQLRCAAPTVGDFVVDLDEFGFQTRQVTEGDQIRLEPLTQVRFQGLDLLSKLLHTVASPPVAYLLLIAGIALLLFEHFSIGVGIAGVIGAVFVVLAGYGFAVLPFRWWALAAIVVAFVLWMLDVQSGVPSPLTLVATAVFAVGTFGLWDGVSMSWVPTAVGIAGMFVVMWLGLPLTIRGRFGTPRIDRDDFVGDDGTVVADGLVSVRGARWPARRSDGAPLVVGDAVSVVAVDGLVFDVAPAGSVATGTAGAADGR